MGETVLAKGGAVAMMDNFQVRQKTNTNQNDYKQRNPFQARQFRQDYQDCRLIDVPKPYSPDKNAFIITKDSPYR